MGEKTEIQWCDDTVNPTMGCDGCELWSSERKTCYAGKLHDLRAGHAGYAPRFEDVTPFPGRTAKAARLRDLTGTARPEKPWLDGQPRLIFVSDMGDSLSISVTFEYLEREVIGVASSSAGARHEWLWLTKRPERMASFSAWLHARGTAWPPNIWAGTSVTHPGFVKRIDALAEVGDANTIRFASVEPQTDPITLGARLQNLDWVIQGGESGAKPKVGAFDLAWARAMRDECRANGVAYFLKQLGRRPVEDGRELRLRDLHGGDWSEWPVDLRVREMPSIVGKKIARGLMSAISTSSADAEAGTS